MGPRSEECWETILDDSEVEAAWMRVVRSEREIGCDMSCRTSTAAAAARWKDSEMTVGCMPDPDSATSLPTRWKILTFGE